MARNLELKVACDEAGLADVRARAAEAGVASFTTIAQVDTYFNASRGRLKLREQERDGAWVAELIAYTRPDDASSRWSDYQRVAIAPDQVVALKQGLGAVCGIAGVIRKRRKVGELGRTRIHLDRVEGLGSFVELETVIAGQEEADAAAEHARVIAALGLSRYDAIAGSYGDLLDGVERGAGSL